MAVAEVESLTAIGEGKAAQNIERQTEKQPRALQRGGDAEDADDKKEGAGREARDRNLGGDNSEQNPTDNETQANHVVGEHVKRPEDDCPGEQGEHVHALSVEPVDRLCGPYSKSSSEASHASEPALHPHRDSAASKPTT